MDTIFHIQGYDYAKTSTLAYSLPAKLIAAGLRQTAHPSSISSCCRTRDSVVMADSSGFPVDYDDDRGNSGKMAKLTILFGIVLIFLGGFGFVATGSHAPTSLIPSYVGIVFVILGFFAFTPDTKRRMLFMHIAVTLGLLGFLGTIKSGLIDFFQMVNGRQFPHPIAVEEKAAMCVLLLVFVILCVRSFIAARRARV